MLISCFIIFMINVIIESILNSNSLMLILDFLTCALSLMFSVLLRIYTSLDQRSLKYD